MNADRNLLFGILALQMDFISRDELIAAMHAWVLDKSNTLGEILVAQGALERDTHVLLDSLVEKHLALHGRDPAKSLAAIGALGSAWDDLSRVPDPDLQESLRRVPGEQPATDAAGDTLTVGGMAVVGNATSAGKRFRIVRPHAKGGLGQVWVAIDQELHREVALKEIQSEFADDPNSRSRFVVEAEITGGLEHPGVVPVYGLGQDAQGRPFYAMRFIKGDSLKSAIERFHRMEAPDREAGERALSLRKLLGRFIDVCNAIEYAHSRGVLHRDLKPGNIMLGKYGETLVVDWGLAKNVERTESPSQADERTLRPASAPGSSGTLMGSAVGTPAFMSPEQAAGRLDQLGPASDVYSLGATLYALLTGHAPVEDRNVETMLDKVRRGAFPRPRMIKHDVHSALEAVCLKAMALAPADRYAAPRLLADDIEHWLADEPVSAYAEPWTARLARWTRRHRAWTRAAAAALIVVTVMAVLAAVLVSRQKQIALDERARAVRQEQQAERNFEHAVAAANAMVEKVAAGLRPLAGTKAETVESILNSAAGVYDNLLADAGQRSELLAGQGRMLNLFSEIYIDLGNSERAISSARQALSLHEALVKQDPGNAAWQSGLADSFERLGLAMITRGQSMPARSAFEECLDIRRELLARSPDDVERKSDLARAIYRLANVLEIQGDYEQSTARHQEAFDIRRRVAEADPSSVRWQCNLASSRQYVAQAQLDAGRDEEALTNFQAAFDALQRLADEEPDNAERQIDLADSAVWYGGVVKGRGECERSKVLFEQHERIVRRLVEQDPNNAEARRRELRSRLQLGDLVCDAGSLDQHQIVRTLKQQAAVLNELLDLAGAMSAKDPGNYVWHDARSVLPLNAAVILQSLAQLGEQPESNLSAALEMCRVARQRAARLIQRDPDNAQWAALLARSHDTLGHIYSAQGKNLDSIRERLESEELRCELAARLLEKHPGSARWRSESAYSQAKCATYRHMLSELGQSPKQNLATARREAQQSIERFTALLAEQPDNADWLNQLATAEGALAIVLSQQGDQTAAQGHYTKSREASRRADEIDQAKGDSARAARERYGCSVSVLAFRVISVREQAGLARGSLSLSEQLERLVPSADHELGLVQACWNLADTLVDAPTRDHAAEARLAVRRARGLLKKLGAGEDGKKDELAPWLERFTALDAKIAAVAAPGRDEAVQASVDELGYLAVARQWIGEGRARPWLSFLSRELEAGECSTWAVYTMLPLAEDTTVLQAMTRAAREMLAEDAASISLGGQRLIGSLAQSAGDFETAAEFYRRLVAARADDAAALEALANVLLAAWRNDEAEDILARLVPLKPDPIEALPLHQTLAEVRLGLGRIEACSQTIASALEIDPDDYYNRVLAARLLAVERRFDEAREELQQLVAAGEPSSPALVSARIALALVEDELGNAEQAESLLREALQVQDTVAERAVLAYVRMRHGSPLDEVRAVLEECHQQQPGNLYISAFYALALARGPNPADGLARLDKLAAHPLLAAWPDFLDELGDAYLKAQRPDDARAAWRKALAAFPATASPTDRRKLSIERKLETLRANRESAQ
ncbi:MAG: protein kinase [Pirellulales bacterium]